MPSPRLEIIHNSNFVLVNIITEFCINWVLNFVSHKRNYKLSNTLLALYNYFKNMCFRTNEKRRRPLSCIKIILVNVTLTLSYIRLCWAVSEDTTGIV